MARLTENLYVDGTLGCNYFNAPNESIGDAAFDSAHPLSTAKQVHKFLISHHQRNADDHATETVGIHTVLGATGLIKGIRAWLVTVPVGAATVTIDLKKNGTSVLSGGVITLNSSSVTRTPVAGTINGTLDDTVAGDVLELVIVATAGGGTLGKGLCITVDVDEAPAA